MRFWSIVFGFVNSGRPGKSDQTCRVLRGAAIDDPIRPTLSCSSRKGKGGSSCPRDSACSD